MVPGGGVRVWAELRVQGLDGVGGVEDATHVRMQGVERHDLVPGAPPALADGRIVAIPGSFLEGGERSLARTGVERSVDAL